MHQTAGRLWTGRLPGHCKMQTRMSRAGFSAAALPSAPCMEEGRNGRNGRNERNGRNGSRGLACHIRGIGGNHHVKSALITRTAVRSLKHRCIVHRQVKTSRTFLRDATAASPLALALFGSGKLEVVHEGGYMSLDGWLRFRAPAQVVIALVKKQLPWVHHGLTAPARSFSRDSIRLTSLFMCAHLPPVWCSNVSEPPMRFTAVRLYNNLARFRWAVAAVQAAVLVRRLRGNLESHLEALIAASGGDSSGGGGGGPELVDVVARLLEEEEAAMLRDRG